MENNKKTQLAFTKKKNRFIMNNSNKLIHILDDSIKYSVTICFIDPRPRVYPKNYNNLLLPK